MNTDGSTILVIGESSVGKTHYGAQLLKRLMAGGGQLSMHGAATNLAPFEAAMGRLNEGFAADHTATSTYVESVWPIVNKQGRKADLVWPDYGGEQVKLMSATRRVPAAWRARIVSSPGWLFLVRLNQLRATDDVFSRRLADLRSEEREGSEIQLSDQTRLIELLQMLVYLRGVASSKRLVRPRLSVLLTCWDELATDKRPASVLRERLPMLSDFIYSTWADPDILGLSALGRSLKAGEPDEEYVAQGPEQFGFVVLPDGQKSNDLTLPIQRILSYSPDA